MNDLPKHDELPLLNEINEAIVRKYWLRAIEWLNWPSFVSQPIVPILFIFYRWLYVLGAVFSLDLIWVPIRYRYVSPTAADAAVPFVAYGKWPAAVGSAIYLFTRHEYFVGALALGWPFVCGLIVVPGKVGVVQRTFMRKVGLESLLSPR